jgi:hypothetical protein
LCAACVAVRRENTATLIAGFFQELKIFARMRFLESSVTMSPMCGIEAWHYPSII